MTQTTQENQRDIDVVHLEIIWSFPIHELTSSSDDELIFVFALYIEGFVF